MQDESCVQFLQWVLPQLHMRWPGFRKVHAQVCKRLQRRLNELMLNEIAAYADYLAQHQEEWRVLDALLRISISRFYRDRMMFAFLETDVLPALAAGIMARGENTLHIWSAGCAAGEEAYTLAIIWHLQLQHRFPGVRIRIVATDADEGMCRRAEQACYAYSSIKNLPAAWREKVFDKQQDTYLLKPAFRKDCVFQLADVRHTIPAGRFHLVLCRNLVLTYFDHALQASVLRRITSVIGAGGALVIGIHEQLPEGMKALTPWHEKLRIYRKIT